MIDVSEVVRAVPHFDKFSSVAELHALVEELRTDPGFEIEVAGSSANGVPIHYLRFGQGSVQALVVAFPHCKEPIGGLTVYSLMTLLHQRHPALVNADVEWHIVPCIDPDGALLNEGWTQQPVTMESYVKGFYVQVLGEQVDGSFPLKHKNLVWTTPSIEAEILRTIIDRVQPDFFYSLHNAWTGGAQYFLNRDIGSSHYEQLYKLLAEQNVPVQKQPIWREFLTPFGEGVVENWSVKKFYDYLERSAPNPEEFIIYGGGSWDYLEEVKPDALVFVTEIGYVLHPKDDSEKLTGQNLRQFRLRVDADSKFLAAEMLEQWDLVKDDVDSSHPLYHAIETGAVLPAKDRLLEGGRPMALQPTRDILFNPQYNREATESDAFQACMVNGGLFFLCQSYQFVRLLKDSPQTPAVRTAIERLDPAFDAAIAQIDQYVDLSACVPIDHDTLARVQLGSGLVAINSLL